MMTVKDARTLLPKVGDKRMEVPTVWKSSGCTEQANIPPQPCTVVEVNREHLWYRVRFEDSGWHECFKVPRLKLRRDGGLL